MNFDFDLDLPSIEKMGLIERGKIHKIVDQRFMHYMKLKIPIDSYSLVNSVREFGVGTIKVMSPYAHYMNEGIVYVDPEYGFAAMPLKDKYGNLLGFYSRKGVKKVPSGRQLNYSGGSSRGSHFVERTIAENTDDIIRDITPFLGGNNK